MRGAVAGGAVQSGGAAGRVPASGLLVVVSALLFIVVFKLHSVLPALPRPALILSPIALLLAWQQSTAAERNELWQNVPLKIVLAYFSWAVLTIPTSIYKSYSLDMAVTLIPLVVMFVTICLLPASRRTVDFLLRTLMYGGTLLGLASLAVNQRMTGRLGAPAMFDPNDLGAIMAVTGSFALGQILRGTGWSRMVAVGALTVSAWTLAQTASRGSSIGFAVAIGSVVLMAGGKRRYVGIALLLLGGALFTAKTPELYRERISTVGQEDYNTTSYDGRTQIWKRGIQYAVKNPVFGVGVGAFEVAEGNQLIEMGRAGKWSASHNAYVQSFAELGFPGGLLFAVLIAGSLKITASRTRLWRKNAVLVNFERPEVFGAFAGLAVSSFFLSFAYFPYWFALWGIISLMLRVHDDAGGVPGIPASSGPSMRSKPAPEARYLRHGVSTPRRRLLR